MLHGTANTENNLPNIVRMKKKNNFISCFAKWENILFINHNPSECFWLDTTLIPSRKLIWRCRSEIERFSTTKKKKTQIAETNESNVISNGKHVKENEHFQSNYGDFWHDENKFYANIYFSSAEIVISSKAYVKTQNKWNKNKNNEFSNDGVCCFVRDCKQPWINSIFCVRIFCVMIHYAYCLFADEWLKLSNFFCSPKLVRFTVEPIKNVPKHKNIIVIISPNETFSSAIHRSNKANFGLFTFVAIEISVAHSHSFAILSLLFSIECSQFVSSSKLNERKGRKNVDFFLLASFVMQIVSDIQDSPVRLPRNLWIQSDESGKAF